MNKAPIVAFAMLAWMPASAVAQERAGDAALGAVSGAIVLGPVGAVAGALVGYTAGPSIARSWGMRGSRPATHRRPVRREASRSAGSSTSPRTREAMDASGQMRTAGNPAPPAQAAPAAPAHTSPPPVQGFD